MLVFEDRGKPQTLEKNFSEQRRQPTTNSTHIWHWARESNSWHNGGRQALSPQRHPWSPNQTICLYFRWVTIHCRFRIFWDYWTFSILKFNNASKVILFLHPPKKFASFMIKISIFFPTNTLQHWNDKISHLQNTK